MTSSERWRGAACGLGAAALFGMSTPLAKRLLPATGPLALAALLYLGAGAGLVIAGLVRGRAGSCEARLRRTDVPALFGIVIAGGIVGPILMLYGLGRVSGVAGALLLNLEAPLTVIVAVTLFREHLGARGLISLAFIVAGAAVLRYRPGELHADWLGVLLIAGACLAWALDNNLTQRLSLRDPIVVVRIKALGAGGCTLAIAALRGQVPTVSSVLALALLLGAVGYGLSIVLDMYALRILGAAREAALFATAPFLGALASVPLLSERLSIPDALAMALMAGGVALLLTERHSHLHTHEEMEHDHMHVHDEHHQHEHEGPVIEPHSHPHKHASLTHEHPHVPDLHNRHRH
jgi:drug/metabolite transporter (DMT)-like permease